MNNTNNALETLVQRDKQIKKANDKLKASINELDAELETTTNALSNHANDANIHTSKEELIQLIVDHLESLDLGITKEVVSVLPTENISDNTLYFVPNEKGYHNEYLYINDKWELVGSTETNFTDYYTKLETNTLLEGKANSVHNHVVSDITDFPTIPTKVSELSNDSNFVTSTELHDYATKNDLNSKQDALSEEQLSNIDSIPDKVNKSDLSTVATSGSYKDLVDKPVIPEGADLSDYYNKGETDNLLNSKANTSDLAVVAKSGNYNDLNNTPTIPTKVSDLTNDSGYITSVSWEDVTSKPELSQVAISGSYSDLSGTPTIPTRTSQLINDSGFLTSSSGVITSVSWSDITDKPNFSTVATSGSYTDLSNTPTIPTKVSQLENDMGFGTGGDTSDCVHKTGNETIDGTKTFVSGPWVTNNHNTTGYSIKNTALARNDIPSEYQHYTFRAYDKNNKIIGEYCIEKATTGDALLSMNVRSEDSSGTQISYGTQFRMTNDGSLVRFMPSANNKVHLGDVGAKWASVHATNAHITNTYTNRVTTYSITHPTDDSYFFVSGGTDYNKGASLYLGGAYAKNFTPGRFVLTTRAADYSTIELTGSPDGSLTWGGKSLALDENLVHRTGNEAISGTKKFLNDIFRKNTSADLTVTPTGYTNTNIIFADKNDKTLAHIEYVQRPSGVNDVGIFAWDKNGNAHGIHINTNNEVIPLMSSSESYSLGSATYKWGKIYSNDIVHTSGDEYINGNKIFSNAIHRYADLTTSGGVQVYRFDDTNANPCGHIYNNVHWHNNAVYNRHGSYNAKSGKTLELDLITNGLGRGTAYISGTVTDLGNLTDVTHRIDERALATMGWVNNPATSTNVVHRSGDETISGIKRFNNIILAQEFHSTTGNAFMAQNGGYTFLIRNDGSNTYLLMSDKDGTPGTWSTARPLIIDNSTGVCNINGNANSATYSTTPATTDNSTRIATTAWVRHYVDSVAGSNTVGSSVSAYWSNSSDVTATGLASGGGIYPACYSEYITKTPTVGTIYSGAQLYTVLNTYASARASTTGQEGSIKVTNITAQATFSNPISPTGKYLCTTANTVKFRAYVTSGNSSTVGTASVVDNSSTKSIFIRVQ